LKEVFDSEIIAFRKGLCSVDSVIVFRETTTKMMMIIIIIIIIIMYYSTIYNWSQWNSNEKHKEKPGSFTRKTFDSFTTENSYTWKITHNTEGTAV
jgi:hypothetical protein